MKDIKLRAWDSENKTMWVQDDETITIQDCYNIGRIEGNDLIIWIGKKDKNGEMLCTKDIFKYDKHDGYILPSFIGVVEYIEDLACFGYRIIDEDKTSSYPHPFAEHDELEKDILPFIEIIGSIHENPDSLEKKLTATIIGSTQYQDKFDELKTRLKGKGFRVLTPAFDHHDMSELEICKYNRGIIEQADIVYLIYDGRSVGAWGDFCMAFALRKPVKVEYYESKSIKAVINDYEKESIERSSTDA